MSAACLAITPSAGAAVLHNQNNGGNGTGWFAFDDTDSTDFAELADDFVVPASTSWTVRGIEVTGHYGGGTSGPISSVNVRVYTDSSTLPSTGAPVFERLGIIPVNGLAGPSFSIPLTEPAPTFAAGGSGTRYWLSVQVNANHPGTIWNWENRESLGLISSTRDNLASTINCGGPTTWGYRSDTMCGGQGLFPDQKFSLSDTVPTAPTTTPPLQNPTQPAAKKKCKRAKKGAGAITAKKKKCKKKKKK